MKEKVLKLNMVNSKFMRLNDTKDMEFVVNVSKLYQVEN